MVRLRCGWLCLGEVGAVHDHGQAGVGGGRLSDQAPQVGDSREEDSLVGCDGNVAASATRHLHHIFSSHLQMDEFRFNITCITFWKMYSYLADHHLNPGPGPVVEQDEQVAGHAGENPHLQLVEQPHNEADQARQQVPL